jgi:hypothetical protein
MDVPEGTTDQGLREFDEFYTQIHVPEVVAVSKFLRGTRYELHHCFRHPEPGSPRFLAVYEGTDESLDARAARARDPGTAVPLSSGPPTWEGHVTAWRLLYRRIDSQVRSDSDKGQTPPSSS